MCTAITRRAFSRGALALAAAAIGVRTFSQATEASASPTPVILDTDIGDDIDDTWALLMLLRMPELDLKLAVSDLGNARYRCRLLAKLLQLTGRTDVPVGLDLDPTDEPGQQSSWIGDYQLDDYPGIVQEDGVQAIIETIREPPQPVTFLRIGPVPNVAEASGRNVHCATGWKDMAAFERKLVNILTGSSTAHRPLGGLLQC